MSFKLAKLTGILTLAFTVSFLAACDDVNDAQQRQQAGELANQTSEVVDSVIDEFFNDNEALNSLDGLGSFIAGITGSGPLAPFSASPTLDVWGSERQMAKTHEALLEQLGRRHAGDLYVTNIPSALLGATCIWDPNLQGGPGYVDDPSLTGAPANGIRFRLYTIDPTDFLPVEPLDDIGYIDIIDLSGTSTLDVDVLANVGGTPLLDYGVTGSDDGQGNSNLNMSGFVSNGTDQLNFSLTASGTTAGAFTIAYDIDFGPISVSYNSSYDASTENSSNTWVINDDLEDFEIRIVLNLNESTGNLNTGSGVWFNDTQVAEFQGSNFDFTLVPTEDSPLTNQDLALLTVAAFALEFELLFVLEELFFFAVSLTSGGVG
jgi:hypothetical protein